MTESGVDLSAILGRNAKALRGSANLDDVAKAARRYGLNWSTGRVSDLEHGRVSPTVQTLVALALALGEVRDEKLTFADLVRTDHSHEMITVTKDLAITGDELKSFLAGAEVSLDERYQREITGSIRAGFARRKEWPARLQRVSVGLLRQVSRDYGEPETLLARDLGIDHDQLVAEMAAKWGQSFHAERDKRAGPGANAQKKGRVARTLKAELKAVLDGDD